MGKQTNIDLDFADGRYNFRLTWDGIEIVERASLCGFGMVVEHIGNGNHGRVDMLEIIRQGLLGGSGGISEGRVLRTGPERVEQLIEHYVTGELGMSGEQIANLATCITFAAYFGHDPKMIEAAQ